MFKKKITIIICSYNNSLYLKKCLESIFNQSLSQNYYNVILVDDKSEDNSLEITKQYQDKKNFTIIKNYKNIGLVKSCNKAIKIAKTKFIVRVDSDDYVSNKFVATFLENINKKYDFIFSNYKVLKKKKITNVDIVSFKDLISCSVAMNKNILIKIGGYKNFLWEEYDLYLRYLTKTKKILKINEYLYFYRYHQSNMTKLKSWKVKAWKELYKTHKKSALQKLNTKIILSSK